ncbi:helix-turn-helix domain-containing protein [Aliifodinibius sp. S!AR15-10]|uniref:helix-turn-helix domain-containing protein n=1 Tax=Aliifodinibius sp. S!AR15-10 TaxID=2950437 RepID=UPI002856BED6|nr:helix-turn-helix domain-containing protein [Aliifodinibius sp. S!AR15-10]MDR8389502.1 helix-turn-helix domain-containing protein [Aliifodinibius sp. S!AR15-10]
MKNSIQITFSDELLDAFTQAIKEAVKEELPKYQNSFKKDWLSTEEVMEMLKVSRRTVQNYRDEGKISYFQQGRKILYPREGIEEFLRKNMIKAYR